MICGAAEAEVKDPRSRDLWSGRGRGQRPEVTWYVAESFGCVVAEALRRKGEGLCVRSRDPRQDALQSVFLPQTQSPSAQMSGHGACVTRDNQRSTGSHDCTGRYERLNVIL